MRITHSATSSALLSLVWCAAASASSHQTAGYPRRHTDAIGQSRRRAPVGDALRLATALEWRPHRSARHRDFVFKLDQHRAAGCTAPRSGHRSRGRDVRRGKSTSASISSLRFLRETGDLSIDSSWALCRPRRQSGPRGTASLAISSRRCDLRNDWRDRQGRLRLPCRWCGESEWRVDAGQWRRRCCPAAKGDSTSSGVGDIAAVLKCLLLAFGVREASRCSRRCGSRPETARVYAGWEIRARCSLIFSGRGRIRPRQ